MFSISNKCVISQKGFYTQKQTESSSIFHDHNMKVENQTGKSLPDPNVLVVTADRAKG